MKSIMQLGIGVCGGALAALLYHAADPDRTMAPSAFAVPDSAAERAAPGSLQERAGDLPPVAPFTGADALPAGDWALLDPTGFLDFAEDADSIDDLIAGLEVSIAIDPSRVFEIVSRFHATGSPEVQELYMRAIRGMAAQNPLATIARLQSIANGPQRVPILAAIAAGYSTADPDAALRWAISLLPPSPDSVNSVLESVAATDPLRAYDLMGQAQDRIADRGLAAYTIARTALANGQAPGSLASALAMRGGPDADVVLSAVMQGWMVRDPESAVAWMAGNEGHLTDEVTRAAVYYLAFEDVRHAAALTERIPAAAQEAWLAEVANRYGQFDIDEALQWLPQFRNRTGYAEILDRALLGAATSSESLPDTESVARFIATTNEDVSDAAVQYTGISYADLDPEAAAQWVLAINDPGRAGLAATTVVNRWANADTSAAQRWALGQPRGALRDQFVGALLVRGPSDEALDRRALVGAFTSPAAAQESIYRFIVRDVSDRSEVTAESQAQLEWMLERLTDPDLKRQAEEQIAAAR